MSAWPSTKARRVLAALLAIGWRVKRQVGTSHRVPERDGWADVTFAFPDGEEIGPRMLARIAKKTGLQPGNLRAAWVGPTDLQRPQEQYGADKCMDLSARSPFLALSPSPDGGSRTDTRFFPRELTPGFPPRHIPTRLPFIAIARSRR